MPWVVGLVTLRRGGSASPVVVGAPCDPARVILEFAAELWVWDARRTATWTFVTMPPEVAEDVRDAVGGGRPGFGSVKVQATVGGTTWATSLFPDTRSGGYVLPIKRAVRTAEELAPGDVVSVRVEPVGL